MPAKSWMNSVQLIWAFERLDPFFEMRAKAFNTLVGGKKRKRSRAVSKHLTRLGMEFLEEFPEEYVLFPGRDFWNEDRGTSESELLKFDEEKIILAKAKEKRIERVRNWFYSRAVSMAQSGSVKSDETVDGIFNTGSDTLHPLLSLPARAPQHAEIVASKDMKQQEVLSLISELTKAARDGLEPGEALTRSKRLSIVREAMTTIYNIYKDDDDVKAFIATKISDYYEQKKNGGHGTSLEDSIAEYTANEYRTSTSAFLSRIELVLKKWSVKTGMSFHLTLGGPNPEHPNGKIVMHHFAAGPEAPSRRPFASTYAGFNSFQDAYLAFLASVYPKPVRLARGRNAGAQCPMPHPPNSEPELVPVAVQTESATVPTAVVPSAPDGEGNLSDSSDEEGDDDDEDDVAPCPWAFDPTLIDGLADALEFGGSSTNAPADTMMPRPGDQSLRDAPVSPPRPSTPARPSTPTSTPRSLNDGGPNSPIANAFARMNAQAANPLPRMQPVPIDDFDYTLTIPPPVLQSILGNVEPEEESANTGHSQHRGKRRGANKENVSKRKAPLDPVLEDGRRKSRRLNGAQQDNTSMAAAKLNKKKKNATASGWLEIFANASGTGLEDAEGNAIPLSSVPKAYARDLLPGLDI